eukprot:363000-Chlamydomonas_euryale.AAC.3
MVSFSVPPFFLSALSLLSNPNRLPFKNVSASYSPHCSSGQPRCPTSWNRVRWSRAMCLWDGRFHEKRVKHAWIMGGRTNVGKDGCMDGRTKLNGWVGEWVSGWVDGWMDGWMKGRGSGDAFVAGEVARCARRDVMNKPFGGTKAPWLAMAHHIDLQKVQGALIIVPAEQS